MKLECKSIKAGVPTINGNVYTINVLENMIENARDRVKGRALMGRLGFGNGPKVCLNAVSHVITNLELKEGCLVSDIEILETQQGNLLKAMLESGLDLTLNPLFVVSKDGCNITDASLIAVDICSVDEANGQSDVQ